MRARLGFDVDDANDLAIADGKLTGALVEPVLDQTAKRVALERFAAARGITPADCLAVGDGANDLAMIGAAGLGVAYRGKPVVAADEPEHRRLEEREKRLEAVGRGHPVDRDAAAGGDVAGDRHSIVAVLAERNQ